VYKLVSTEIFSIILTLILLYKYKVPQNKITPVLRQIGSVGSISPISRDNINIVLSGISSSLPEITNDDWVFGQNLYEDNLSNDINILVITDNAYPKYLKVIKDAPPILFVKGNPDIFNDLPGVAIVGARKTSKNGDEIAKRLASYVTENGWVVVSGLAIGIDTAAHTGALSSGGKTLVVLANGLDKATPLQNADLADEILRTGGAWVSEHSIGVPAMKHHFVPRNRIQIGLSAGSIIVEAAIQSGSLSQARFCVGQNRPLFAVIPQTSSNTLRLNCEGTQHMVKELGAIPIRSKNDYPNLIEVLNKEREIIV
jgi:DNA processing protein